MKLYYDFHIHSVLSPCGDDDMTPNNIVNMALLNGLDIIAISDHNCCANAAAAAEAARKAGIIFLPGIELETAEEIHVLCLFGSVASANCFDREIVAPALPPVENNERIFGVQQIMDSCDNIVGTDKRYLINATAISIDSVKALVEKYGGIAIPAHIDKQTKSLISVFGTVEESLGFRVFELSKNAPGDFTSLMPDLRDKEYFYLHDSDAHYLCDISDSGGDNVLDFESKPESAGMVIENIRRKLI